MKTLRIICFVCAGYYAMQAVGFLFANTVTHQMYSMMPSGLAQNPMYREQQVMMGVMKSFAPWLIIGIAVCLLLGWQLQPLWKFVPVAAILLFAGGLAWLVAFIARMRTATQGFNDSLGNMPASFRSYMQAVSGLGNWAAALPVLLPGILIAIFWWRARTDGSRQLTV